MERSFTSFLIPMMLVVIIWMLFFTDDKKPAQPAAQGPTSVVRSEAGKKVFDAQPKKTFAEVKAAEFAEYHHVVSEWEVTRYLTLY